MSSNHSVFYRLAMCKNVLIYKDFSNSSLNIVSYNNSIFCNVVELLLNFYLWRNYSLNLAFCRSIPPQWRTFFMAYRFGSPSHKAVKYHLTPNGVVHFIPPLTQYDKITEKYTVVNRDGISLIKGTVNYRIRRGGRKSLPHSKGPGITPRLLLEIMRKYERKIKTIERGQDASKDINMPL